MKTKILLSIALMCAVSVFFITIPPVLADFGVVPTVDIPVFESEQKAIVAWNGSVETMIISTDVNATENTTAIEILPLPSNPEKIEAGDLESFNQIQNLIELHAPTTSRYGEDVPGSPGINITFQEKIGAHNITIVEASDAQQFMDWIEDFLGNNGIEYNISSTELEPLVANYINRGMNFFVFDLIELNTSERSVEPIVYQFQTDFLYYPLEISSIASGNTEISLFTVTNDKMEKSCVSTAGFDIVNYTWKGYPRPQPPPVPVEFEINRGELESIGVEIAELFGNSLGGFCGWSTYGKCSSDAECTRGGCSGQVCQSVHEKPVITTCEWLDCYDARKYGVYCGCTNSTCQWLKEQRVWFTAWRYNGSIEIFESDFMIVTSASATELPTPFLIYGGVNYDTGYPVNNPSVTITNLNTSEVFDAETNESSNYYHLVTSSWNVSADDVLRFNISDNGNVVKFNRSVTQEEINNGGILGLNITLEVPLVLPIFDTGTPANPYPSISGTHNGTITPYVTIYNVSKLYTYSCPGTGGHTEHIAFYYPDGRLITEGHWEGYAAGDWHNITFHNFTMQAGHTYYYTIKTGSYPQIHHFDELEAKEGMGIINCTSFVDANGKIYDNWIPAIRLEGEKVNLVTVETDKTVYEQGETVNITVRNGLNYGIVVGVESGCEGTVFFVQKFNNDTWTTLATVCGYCLMAISDYIDPMSSKTYDWNQTVYADRADCGSAQQVSEGTYRIMIRYYYSAELIYNNAYSDNFTIVADAENSTSINDTSGDTDEYKIYLSSRQFVPEPGIDPDFESELLAMGDAGIERAHVVIQFYHNPNTSERAVLYKDFGVELQGCVHNYASFASISCELVSDIVALPNVRWIGKILPDDKISPHIRDYGVGSWAVNPDGTVTLVSRQLSSVG